MNNPILEKNRPLIAPSILNANFGILGEQIAAVEKGAADLLHFDVMDGHFVPSLSFGPGICGQVHGFSDMPLDVHLMISNPESHIQAFIDAGASVISVHAELGEKIHDVIAAIREANVHPGIVINPDTPVESVLPFMPDVDVVLAMSVHPGFGGQKFIPETLGKLQSLRNIIDTDFPGTRLEVDGGLNMENVSEIVQAGADMLVIGTSIFRSDDVPETVRMFHKCAGNALK